MLTDHDMFLLEGHTRPALKQAKSISTEEEIYFCSLLLSKETGKIIAACAAGKRGFHGRQFLKYSRRKAAQFVLL